MNVPSYTRDFLKTSFHTTFQDIILAARITFGGGLFFSQLTQGFLAVRNLVPAIKGNGVRLRYLLTPEEVIEWCKERMAKFKVPRYIQFRSHLPKTATERTEKHALQQEKNLLPSASDMEIYRKKLGI